MNLGFCLKLILYAITKTQFLKGLCFIYSTEFAQLERRLIQDHQLSVIITIEAGRKANSKIEASCIS